jgi:hypothetical protein
MTLEDVLRAPSPDHVHEVAERMRGIEKALPDLPLTAGRFPLTLDRTVGFAGRGLLRPLA